LGIGLGAGRERSIVAKGVFFSLFFVWGNGLAGGDGGGDENKQNDLKNVCDECEGGDEGIVMMCFCAVVIDR